jgi:hypothetical protein
MEILDLIAKISWDTNSKELDTLNRKLGEENKLLEELRNKGRNLEAQMLKTNDPKKVAEYNKQLQAVRKSADAITDSQKKQVEVSKQLVDQQKKLHTELRKTNDPNQVKGLLQGLYKVENQMSVLTTKATTMGAKFGGIGQSLLQGFGLGAGVGGVTMGIQAISGFLSDSIDEILDAEKATRSLSLSLEAVGKGGMLAGLLAESTALSTQFNNLFDNDEIVLAQNELVKYGKLTRDELSQLTKVAIELAAKTGTDVPTAANKLVDVLAGRGASTLRDFGLSLKGAKTDAERMQIVLVDLAGKVAGSSDSWAKSAEGIKRQNEILLADTKEQLGSKLLPIYTGFLSALNDVFDEGFKGLALRATGLNAIFGDSPQDKQKRKEIAKEVAEISQSVDKLEKAIYNANRAGANKGVIKLMQTQLEELRANKQGLISKGQNDAEEVPKEVKKNIEVRKPIKVKPTKIEIDVKDADVLFKDGDATVPNLKSDAIKVAPVTKIENTPEFQNAESEREVIRQKIKDQEKADAEEKARQERIDLYNNTLDLARAAQDQLRIEEDKTNRLIALQEKRVESVRNQSSASLKIEQDRLNELLKKRQQYERAQRVIDAAVITANTAVAISGAIATIAKGGNAITIAANVLSILAGIGAVVASIRSINTDPGFKEGGYTGDGDPSSESTAIGKRPYKYHKKEFVMNEELTRKHRDLFDGLHNKDLVVNKLDDGKWYITQNGLDNNAMVNDHYSVKNDSSMMPLLLEMQGIRSLLKQREVKVENNFDADGFGMAVATQMGGITLKNKRRQW